MRGAEGQGPNDPLRKWGVISRVKLRFRFHLRIAMITPTRCVVVAQKLEPLDPLFAVL